MNRRMTLLAALMGWCFCTTAVAQDVFEDSPRVRAIPEGGGLGLIDDLNVTEFGSSTSISVTNVNGVKTTKVRAGLERMEMIEDPASGVTCKLTKVYGPDDLKQLEDEQPELFMHLSAIPKTIGESEIEINVGVTTTYIAADMDELKAKHPEVFEQYDKYVGKNPAGRLDIRVGRPLRILRGADGGRIELFGGEAEVEALPPDPEVPMSEEESDSADEEKDDGGGE